MHASLAEVARQQGAASSRAVGKLSLHAFGTCLSFKNMRSLFECATQLGPRNAVFVGTAESNLIVSVRPLPDPEPTGAATKKRARDDEDDPQLSSARRKVQNASADVPASEFDEAEAVVSRLRKVKGQSGERGLVSYALSTKSLKSEEVPSVMIQANFSPGVALDVGALKRALGRCWADGMITTDLGNVTLPEEAILAVDGGALSMSFLTHVPKSQCDI